MSYFSENFFDRPIDINMVSQIHAASEERIWYAGFIFGTGEVTTYPFGPINLSIPHDFYDTFNYSGAPLVMFSGNSMVPGASGNFNAAPPVWLKENLPNPISDTETRLVVQEGKYYFASGGGWRQVSGSYPYIMLSSKNQIKKMRLALSGLLYNIFPFVNSNAVHGYLDSGSIQTTRNLPIRQTTSPFIEMSGYFWNPLSLISMNGFSLDRGANKIAFENIPQRFIDNNLNFAIDNSAFSMDDFRGNNLDNINQMLMCRENIVPLYTGILQARYLALNLNQAIIDAARDFGLLGGIGSDEFNITVHGKISWVGPSDCFTIANGTIPKSRGTISTYTLETDVTKTITIDEFVAGGDPTIFTLFSGVSRRGPNFDGFESAANLAFQVPVYNTLPSPASPANTRAYRWDGTDYEGYISDGVSWNSATLLPLKYYEQRMFDAEDIGVIPRSPSGGFNQSGVILEQLNITNSVLITSQTGPKGTKNVYGALTDNVFFFTVNEVDTMQFAKAGESIAAPTAEMFSGTLNNSPFGGVNSTIIQNVPNIPTLVLDNHSYINWV